MENKSKGKGGVFKKINNKGMLSFILKRKVFVKVFDKMIGEIIDICFLE